MGHEEEDKELMMIRMETLKTMIGKLKNKTGQKSSKDGPSLVDEKSRLGRGKALDQSKPIGNSRPSTLRGTTSSPLGYSKSHISKSNPSSPLSPYRSRNNVGPSQSPIVTHHPPSSQFALNHNGSSSAAAKTNPPLMKVEPVSMDQTLLNVYGSTPNVGYLEKQQITTPSQLAMIVRNDKYQVIFNPSEAVQLSSRVSKSIYSSSKSHSDSEISARKNLKNRSSIPVTNTHTAFKPVFSLNKNYLSATSSTNVPPASVSHSTTLLGNTKNLNLPTCSSAVQKKSSALTTLRTSTKTSTNLIKRPSTHTITRPISQAVTKTVNSTILSSNDSTSKLNTSPQPGKILFERTGKVLFERLPKTLPKTQTFAQEFKLIRNKNTLENNIQVNQIATTRTKFYSSGYIPPEMCEKARTILSKYKVVRNKDNNLVDGRKDDATHSPVTSYVSSPATVPSQGKILYQRPSPIGSYKSTYMKKGKAFYPGRKVHGNPFKTFVSRRIKYMKSVDSNHFVIKPPSDVNNLNKQTKKDIILSRHGTNYKVAGNLKSLRRLSGNRGQQLKFTSPTKPATRIGKYKLTRSNSKLTSKSVSAKQYVASQVLKKTLLTSRKKVNKENYCLFYNRFGKCKRGEKCHFIHDPDKIAVCTRFLRGTCKDEGCLFSHKLDPDKMPVCSYFLRGECGRDDCPYRHVNVGESASICEDFLKGYCPKGKECTSKHILDCEEYSRTGSCSKGRSCPLTHRRDIPKKRKYSGSRPPKGFRQKRKKIVNGDNDGSDGDVVDETHPNQGKKHMLPKFISEKIKILRESTTDKPTSFAGIKKFYESTKIEESSKENSDELWGSDFIPLSNYSGGESEEESNEYIQRMFTFKK